MVKVLVVEDEASIREMIALNLRLAGMEAVEADSAEAALPCLLYTSDAADEEDSVDLGGSWIIKKKKKEEDEGGNEVK